MQLVTDKVVRFKSTSTKHIKLEYDELVVGANRRPSVVHLICSLAPCEVFGISH